MGDVELLGRLYNWEQILEMSTVVVVSSDSTKTFLYS